MFSTQRSQNANIIKQGIIKAKYTGDYSELVNNTAAVLSSAIAIAGASSAVQVARGQEPTPVKNVVGSIASNAILIAPIVNKILYGFDLDNAPESAINNLVDSVVKLANTKDNERFSENVLNLAEALATLKDIPLKSARRELESVIRIINPDLLRR